MNVIRATWVLFIVILGASLYALSIVPADMQLPVHWNIYGEADRLMDAKFALLFLPAIILAMILLFKIIGHIEPRKTNWEKSTKAKNWILLAVIALLTVIGSHNVALALGYEIDFMRLLMASTMLLFVIMGNYLPKIRSNFFMGIRTPWTLSSDENWKKTHYFGGRVFMILGGIGLLFAMLLPTSEFIGVVCLLLIVPMLAAPVWYSWKMWQQKQI